MTGALKSYLAEFIGTFALVLIAAGAVCADAVTGGSFGPWGLALCYGLAAMSMVYAYGPISGGHFNPALTIALYGVGRVDPIRAVFFVVSQLLGAALAGKLLTATLHGHPELLTARPFLGACDLSGVGYKAGSLLEAVGAFFLMSAYYASSLDARGRAGAAPLAYAAATAAGAAWLIPLTGGALNPARAFGPAIVSGHWAHWYVYWAGPLVGAGAAALLYENLFLERKS